MPICRELAEDGIERAERSRAGDAEASSLGQSLPASGRTVGARRAAGRGARARGRRALADGERRGLRGLWPFLGPAFIAAVAYVDPGNFATNIAGGAKFGYMLLWVVARRRT